MNRVSSTGAVTLHVPSAHVPSAPDHDMLDYEPGMPVFRMPPSHHVPPPPLPSYTLDMQEPERAEGQPNQIERNAKIKAVALAVLFAALLFTGAGVLYVALPLLNTAIAAKLSVGTIEIIAHAAIMGGIKGAAVGLAMNGIRILGQMTRKILSRNPFEFNTGEYILKTTKQVIVSTVASFFIGAVMGAIMGGINRSIELEQRLAETEDNLQQSTTLIDSLQKSNGDYASAIEKLKQMRTLHPIWGNQPFWGKVPLLGTP